MFDQVRRGYEAACGAPPQWTAGAPGRVNLMGEHTDYNDGYVLPLAIDRRLAVAAGPSMIETGEWSSAAFEESLRINFAEEPRPACRHWANHALGVAWLFQQSFGPVPPFNLRVESGIPVGAGLSSSAALEAAVATLLERMTGQVLDPLEKARLCQRAEHEFTGTPCGLMDQLAVTRGRAGHVMLIDCRSNDMQHVPLPPSSEATLLLIDTGVRRALSEGRYAERRRTCHQAARTLGLRSLRDATPQQIERSSLNAAHRKIALHVVAENMRTVLAAEALVRNDLAELGRLMLASHDSLRDLFEVSWPEADAMVSAARRIGLRGGIFGARMTGGGFGGCVIALCRTDALDEIARDVQTAFTAAFDRGCDVFAVSAVDA
jgi:galactokinase